MKCFSVGKKGTWNVVRTALLMSCLKLAPNKYL